MKTRLINWSEAAKMNGMYKDVLDREFVDWDLYIDDYSDFKIVRWVPNQEVAKEIFKKYNVDGILKIFDHDIVNKNDPEIRKLYKALGYSLNGFWEIFYWAENNPEQHEYRGRLTEEEYMWLVLKKKI